MTIDKQELSEDIFHVDPRPIGSIPCGSVVTVLLFWQGKLFVGSADRLVKVWHNFVSLVCTQVTVISLGLYFSLLDGWRCFDILTKMKNAKCVITNPIVLIYTCLLTKTHVVSALRSESISGEDGFSSDVFCLKLSLVCSVMCSK